MQLPGFCGLHYKTTTWTPLSHMPDKNQVWCGKFCTNHCPTNHQPKHDTDNINHCNPKPQPGNSCNENANPQLEKKGIKTSFCMEDWELTRITHSTLGTLK
jgi:hypothetical protein